MAAGRKEYQMAIRIAGEIHKSLPEAAKVTKSELRAIAKEAARSSQEAKAGWDWDGVSDSLQGVNKVGTAAFRAIKNAAKDAAVATGAIAGASIKVGMDYEKQMSAVKAISGATKSEFKALQDEAKEMGATTVFSAKESGEAMEYMAMAGWKAGDMLSGTEGIMDLAAAADEDLGTVADIVTDSLTAFNKEAKDSAHFSDVLAKTSATANTNVSKMGESFKQVAPIAGALGYGIEDVSVNLAAMANSGIKASQAGTSERSWLTRMAKPTKESQAAMDALGISLTDSEGKMKSLQEVTEDTRKAFRGLSEADKSKFAAMLAGKTGMAGLLAIVNTTDKDFKNLTHEINHASGAAKEMAEVRLDNLEGDVTLFKSAMEGAGIEIYEEIKEPLRDLVQTGTKWIGDFAEGFTEKWPTICRELEDAGEAIGDFADPFLDVGGWLLDHPDVLTGAITGIGTALITYKVASGVSSLAKSLKSLAGNKAGLAVLVGGAVVSGIVAIGEAIEESAKQAARADLEEHFGDIALSADELDAAARNIVGHGYLARVEELLDAKDASSGLADQMQDAMREIQKTNWKIEAGITLKKGDKAEYKNACREYVKDAQDYVDNQGYTVSVAIKTLFGDNDNGISRRSDRWYKDLDGQVEKLGERLNKALNKKLTKSFTITDKEKVVNQLLGDIDDITQLVADAQDAAKLDLMETKWSGVDMNAESFANLQAEINDYVDEAKSGAEEAYSTLMTSLEGQRRTGTYRDAKGEKHKYTEEMFRRDAQKAQEAYYNAQADAMMNGYDFMMGKIREKYGDDIDQTVEGLRKEIASSIDEMDGDEGRGSEHVIQSARNWLAKESALSDAEKDAVYSLLEQMAPTVNSLAELQGKAESQGVSLERGSDISQAEGEVNAVTAATYNMRFFHPEETEKLPALYYMAGRGYAGSSDDVSDLNIYKNAHLDVSSEKLGDDLRESLANGFKDAKDEADIQAAETRGIIEDNFKAPIKVAYTFQRQGALFSPFTPSLIGDAGTKKSQLPHYAAGGRIGREQDIRIAEGNKAEYVVPTDKTARAFGLWKEAGLELGALSLKDNPDSFHGLMGRLTGIAPVTATPALADGGGTMNISFSPQITIQGDASEKTVRRAVEISFSQFESMMKKYEKRNGRVSYH